MKRIEPKYKLFKVGDTVLHKESSGHLFRIMEVLIGVPEKKGEYLYKCRIVKGGGDKRKIYNYHEAELTLAAGEKEPKAVFGSMDKKEIIAYWVSSSDIDFKALGSLFKNRHYVWSLFLGHLVLEKLLKAVYVKNVDGAIPYSHDLTKIAEKAGLALTEEQKDLLDAVTTFNIRARYPDYKGKFYKKATKKFAEYYLKQMKDFRQWLLKKIKE
jgi:HEPN domain-containing protein